MTLRYVRVKDLRTGHEYDVLEQQVDDKIHEPLDKDRYPVTSRPRDAKPLISKGGGSAELTARSSLPRLKSAAETAGIDITGLTTKQEFFDAITAAQNSTELPRPFPVDL